MRCLHYSDHPPKATALPPVTLPSFFFCDLAAVLHNCQFPGGIFHDQNISGLPRPVMAPDRRFGPRLKTYKIAAVFETGVSSYDDAFVFMPVRKAQAYFGR